MARREKTTERCGEGDQEKESGEKKKHSVTFSGSEQGC